MLKKYELKDSEFIKLSNYCKKKNFIFFVFFSHLDLDIIKKCKIDYIKIPSGEINNYPLLIKISKYKKNYYLNRYV